MAVKLPDTLVPMADFPSAFAKDVQFTDGENLQDKLDKGKLGSSSSGTGLTEEQANNIEKIPSIEGIVTSNSQAITNKADKDHEHTEYLKEIPDEYVTDTELSTELDKKVNKEVDKGLSTNDLTNELVIKINSSATEAFVTNAIANAQLDGGDVDLSGYATVDALNLKADLTHTHDQYLTEVPDEYITETELTDKNYADKEYVTQAVSNVNVDLTEYAKTSDIPTKVSQLTNDSNFITTIPDEYITETELANELSTRNVKTYTNITQLGLTAPVITGNIYNALPENSIFQCEIVDNKTVSDTPENTGMLTIQKSSKRLAIEFKACARYSVFPNNLYLGQLKGDDGSGITWNKVALSSDLEGCVTDTELSSKGYATETFVTDKIAEASLSGSDVDISNLQPKTDNSLATTDKTVTGAINEVNGNLLDTVGFSADYKNIILNRKSGLNPYTIPIASIINNTSLTELKDIDGTDIGNGKTLIYDGATGKHKYVGSTGTDELVKMDFAGDAHYLVDLLDKQTVINDNGILKVKKLDGQEVTITEINYLKGLTMNVMDLVNAFANGGVKVWETPVNTYSDLSTLDRSTFIEGISYIVYVLADETHAGAKTTYLCTKTSTTFFGNADSQRNFTTNPIDLANEVTGKLGTSNIDVDNLWALLTINDTYKTLTTNNEIFGTHGAKAMYDELVTSIGEKANATDLTTHTNATDIHVTTTDKAKWDKVDEKVDKNSITTTIDSTSTDTQVPSAKAVNELFMRGTLIDQSVIDKYGTEIIKYPLGRWCIDGNDIAGKFSDIPWGTACIIDITSPIISTRNPWDNTWAYRNYSVQTVENKGTFIRQLESRGTPGVLLDTGWQKIATETQVSSNETRLTTVETQVSELFQSVSNGKSLVANAITGKGVSTSSTATFATMATNISNISKIGGYKKETKSYNISSSDITPLTITFSANVLGVKQVIPPTYGSRITNTKTSSNMFTIDGKELTLYVSGIGTWKVTALIES